jgi:hypothetical protein
MAVNHSALEAVCRWAGWSAVHGPRTVATTYETIGLDEHLNTFGLAYGLVTEDKVWQRRLDDFLGRHILRPAAPFRDRGRASLSWERRMEAYWTAEVVAARAECNAACRALILEAEANLSVNPIRRYREPASIIGAHRRAHASSPTSAMLAVDAAMSHLWNPNRVPS